MKRRVIKHGPSYIVSLPSKWVKHYNVHKGDELDVEEKGSTLIVSSTIVRSDLSITKDVSGLIPRLVDRFLARAYQKGYDKIHLIHGDIALLDVIQRKVHELIGYEIIEQNEKSCHIQSITSKIELDFDTSLRKAFLLVKEMGETTLSAYTAGDTPKLQNLYLKDLEVNRMCYFCLRQINKEHYSGPERTQQTLVLYYLVEILEDLGDSYKKLAALLAECPLKNTALLHLLKMLQEQYELSYSYFYKASKDKANQAYMLFQKIGKEIEAACEKKPKKEEILSLLHIRECAHITYHFTTMRLDLL